MIICQVHEKCLVNGSRLVKESNPNSSNKAETDISKFVPVGNSKNNWRKHLKKAWEPEAEAEDMAAEKMPAEKEGKSRKRNKLSTVAKKTPQIPV